MGRFELLYPEDIVSKSIFGNVECNKNILPLDNFIDRANDLDGMEGGKNIC